MTNPNDPSTDLVPRAPGGLEPCRNHAAVAAVAGA